MWLRGADRRIVLRSFPFFLLGVVSQCRHSVPAPSQKMTFFKEILHSTSECRGSAYNSSRFSAMPDRAWSDHHTSRECCISETGSCVAYASELSCKATLNPMPHTKRTVRGSDGHLERTRSRVATPTRFYRVTGDSSMYPRKDGKVWLHRHTG